MQPYAAERTLFCLLTHRHRDLLLKVYQRLCELGDDAEYDVGHRHLHGGLYRLGDGHVYGGRHMDQPRQQLPACVTPFAHYLN